MGSGRLVADVLNAITVILGVDGSARGFESYHHSWPHFTVLSQCLWPQDTQCLPNVLCNTQQSDVLSATHELHAADMASALSMITAL